MTDFKKHTFTFTSPCLKSPHKYAPSVNLKSSFTVLKHFVVDVVIVLMPILFDDVTVCVKWRHMTTSSGSFLRIPPVALKMHPHMV